ncbi:MAG: alpha/beta hydrolase [Oscillospiraceae bacterium]|nr:alpha/beta hydrolase [Oscillospiraceae bacterium]
MSLFTYLFRKNCTKSDAQRDAGLTTPPQVERYDGLVYGSDPVWQSLDLYCPKGQTGSLPVIVSFHGGGWVYGTKETYQFYCMDLARRGFAVINYNYRLAPEHRYPAAMEDTNLVFRWLAEHAGEYALDLSRLFAVGDSAGAMGIALYACILTNPAYAAKYSFHAPEGICIRGLGLNCGMYTAKDKERVLRDMLPKRRAAETLPLLNALDHITADFPPCYIMTANQDFLRHEPQALTDLLDRLHIPYHFRMYGSEENPLGHVFHCNIRSADARAVNDAECDFFRSLTEKLTD